MYVSISLFNAKQKKLLLVGQKTRSSSLNPLSNRSIAKHGDKKLLKIWCSNVNKPLGILTGHSLLQFCDPKTLELIWSVKPIQNNRQIETMAANGEILDLFELLETRLDHLIASKRLMGVTIEAVAE